MTVTTAKTTTNVTTTRQSDKKPKYNFISSLLTINNNSSTSFSSGQSSMDSSTNTTVDEIKKKSKNNANPKYKLFKPWSQSQDSEYKSLEKALARFQSKDRHKVEILKTIVIPWLKKYITVNTTDKGLQYGRMIFLKWWKLLITFLPEAAYNDRTLYFECILILMTRSEFDDLDRIGPIPQLDATDTYMDIPVETILTYRGALMKTLHYAIDRLNQKGVYSNVISFCARVLAICFFKIPGVGFSLLQALPVSKSHIKRILKETIGDEDESMELIKIQNDKIASCFPNHLKILCYINLRTWWYQLEDAKKIWGEPPIEMNGNWIRRWQSDDSELFFSFYKHYHIVLKTYLNISNSTAFKSMTPPFKYIIAPGYIHLASFFLLKIDSLIHRNIHTITTVIQFEQPNNNDNNLNNNSINMTNTINPDDTAIGMGSLPAANIRIGSDENSNSSIGNNNNSKINAIAINTSINSNNNNNNSGKPKVLEMAGKRFVETMVAIVENGYFQEMCNIWIKAVIKKTNMYDVESVFCLLDFIDTLIVELDTRDSIVMSMEPSSTNSITSSDSSNDSNVALFSPPNLINIIDVSFYISLIQILLSNSDHTITILRTISFIYTHFGFLTSQPNHLKHLVKDILLNEHTFEELFCHWSRNIRIYYMRLLVWRVGRIVEKPLDYCNNDDGNDNFIGENGYVMIDIFTSLQNRLENLQTCFEFITNYSGDIKNLNNVIQTKIEENVQEMKNYSNQTKSQITLSISESTSINSDIHHVSNNVKQHKRKISLKEFKALKSATYGKEISTATTIIQWMLKNNQPKFVDSQFESSSQISSSLSSSSLSSLSSSLLSSQQQQQQRQQQQQQQQQQRHHNSSSISSSSSQTRQSKPLLWHYSLNKHIYVSKAIFEYEAVNQDYAEWCEQFASIDNNNNNSDSSNNSKRNNDDYSIINDNNNWIEIKFPKLTVDYPKYFGNGLVNTMF